jgi:hypothetical protein
MTLACYYIAAACMTPWENEVRLLSFFLSFLQENCSATLIQSLSEIVFSCTIRVGENGIILIYLISSAMT